MSEDSGNRVVVIGAGPAGLTAALYAARAGAAVTVCERGVPGGQAALTYSIENYPGFPGSISGPDLAARMREQAQSFGARFITGDVAGFAATEGGGFSISINDGLQAEAIVIATGASPRRLGVPGEAELIGRGVSFCATCDGPLYRGRHVAVAGGGDAAAEEALFLARFAERVTMVHRRGELRAVKTLADRVAGEPRIEVLWHCVIDSLSGGEGLKAISVTDVRDGARHELAVDGLFVYIGADPNSAFVPVQVERDERGYVITGPDMRTTMDGVFAAGDVRTTVLRQVATAVGDGSIAGALAQRFASGDQSH